MRYSDYKERHLCPNCGQPVEDEYVSCFSCREKKNAYAKSYYKVHLEKSRERARLYKSKTKEERAKKNKVARKTLRGSVLSLLGGKCAHCSFSDFRALQIDHIDGNGRKEMKEGSNSNRLYYYQHILDVQGKGYQILCSNCNWIKRYENEEGFRILI